MRGDLHHLFACKAGCNSFRGNTPFAEFADFPEPTAVRAAPRVVQGRVKVLNGRCEQRLPA
jgi:endonuclease I